MDDTEFTKKTGWFPSTTKPARKGLYETHWLIGSLSALRYWDGNAWQAAGQVSLRQDFTWRGLTEPGQDYVDDYIVERSAERRVIPHEVVKSRASGATPSRAWREHLGLKQAEIAARIGISQPGYRYLERKERLQESSRRKVAEALGIAPEDLDI